MTSKKNLTEQRKYRRFKVRDESLYILNPNSTGLGEIIDISLGGLAFYHVKKQSWSDSTLKMGIMFSDSDVIIDDLPMKTISECAINPIDPGLPDNSTAIWRQSVQFGELTPDQINQLVHIIQNHTTSVG